MFERFSDWELEAHYAQWRAGKWGDARADRRTGALGAVIAEYAGKKRKDDAPPVFSDDLLWVIDARPAKKTKAEILAAEREQAKGLAQ